MGGDTTQYVQDLAATLPVVISDTEAVYLYGLDILAQQQSQRLYYVHDGLGSARQLLDSTGDVETNYAYDPFGVPVVGGDVSNPYRFTGEAWDAEVELLYLRARYYQSEVGRFITRDPWAGEGQAPATLNRYVYVTANPVNLVDPSGSRPEDFLPSWEDPPVVTYIQREMVNNARGPIVAAIRAWNEAWFPGTNLNRGKTSAYGLFAYMVWPGHEWDPKDYIRSTLYKGISQKIRDQWYFYDIWGNIMFGYLGSAAGFTDFELLNGAGLVQIPTDVYNTLKNADLSCLPVPRPWYGLYLPWAWDHPQDRVTSKIGIRLWRERNIHVRTADIIEAVVEAADRGELERRDEPWPWSWY